MVTVSVSRSGEKVWDSPGWGLKCWYYESREKCPKCGCANVCVSVCVYMRAYVSPHTGQLTEKGITDMVKVTGVVQDPPETKRHMV